MIKGKRVSLRPLRDEDWRIFEAWGQSRDALWGPYQRFQLDNLPLLRQAYERSGLLSREAGFLLVETLAEGQVVGFVRYTLIPYPDADMPHPEIGFGIPEASERRQGFAKEAVGLLLGYLFSGYSAERISAFTDFENNPAKRLLERLRFRQEGVLRRAMFRDGAWKDVALFGLLRTEWRPVESNSGS